MRFSLPQPQPLPPGAGEGEQAVHRHNAAFPPLPAAGEGAGGEGVEDYDRWNVPESLRARMVAVARCLRKGATRSEAILWQALRGKQLDGRKFRRQQPIGPFVVDFYCAAERLIVEVDGPIHEAQQEADAARQKLIESLGLRFVRVTAEHVEQDLESVLAIIKCVFKS